MNRSCSKPKSRSQVSCCMQVTGRGALDDGAEAVTITASCYVSRSLRCLPARDAAISALRCNCMQITSLRSASAILEISRKLLS